MHVARSEEGETVLFLSVQILSDCFMVFSFHRPMERVKYPRFRHRGPGGPGGPGGAPGGHPGGHLPQQQLPPPLDGRMPRQPIVLPPPLPPHRQQQVPSPGGRNPRLMQPPPFMRQNLPPPVPTAVRECQHLFPHILNSKFSSLIVVSFQVNYRQEEKKILDRILEPQRYDTRMRPRGVNSTGEITLRSKENIFV